jgi:Leucine-rich repeat (LRR) protein
MNLPAYRHVILVFLASWTATATVVAQDLFPDKNLDAVVRQYVFEKRNTDKPLTVQDVENISTIVGKGKKITNLAGLDKCRSLALLDLADNQVADLTPLKDLKSLQSLNMAKK